MARGFSLQNIACITLEGSVIEQACSPHRPPSPQQQAAPFAALIKESQRQQLQQQQQQEVVETMPQRSINNQSRDESSSSSFYQQQQQKQKEGGGGLIASGLSWFDKQREKRRREHLKLEAQKQIQKIGEAQRQARLSQSSTTSSTTTTTTSKPKTTTTTTNNKPDPHSLVLLPCRSLADSSSGDSSERDIEKDFLQSLDLPSGSSSFGTSDVSKSGEGASGRLSLNDIDGICGASIRSLTLESDIEEESIVETNNETKDETEEAEEEEDIILPVRVTEVDGDDASPYVLSQDQMNEIARHVLPETIKYCRWRRLYGLGRDGDSFDGCLRIIGSEKRTLMVVRTTRGEIFGGYADAPWHSRHDSSTAKFYGSASSCLFSFRSNQSTSMSPEADSSINVYRWTGKNRYIQVCDVTHKMLAFGGGGDKGAFGLCLQEDFQRGTTGHCDTFDNDPLCSNDGGNFDIVDVEFWEFLTGVF